MHPVVLLGVSIELEELFQFLIGSFCLAISPWVECSGGILFDAKGLAHLGCKAAHELGISVVDEYLRESHAFEHVFQVKFGNSFCHY